MSEETQAQAAQAEPSIWPGTGSSIQWALNAIRTESDGKLDFGGRVYTTVAKRVEVFRRTYGATAAIITEVQHVDNDVVRCVARIKIQSHGEYETVATGHAEEWRDASDFNRHSALENAETSAIGRALANLGLHGGEFAALDELVAAQAETAKLATSEAVQFVKPEEIKAALEVISKCSSVDDLAVAYLKLSPALRVAVDASKNAKFKELSGRQSGSAPEKAGSQPPVSGQPPASRQRRAPSSGAA